jgi:hypothetical protein
LKASGALVPAAGTRQQVIVQLIKALLNIHMEHSFMLAHFLKYWL